MADNTITDYILNRDYLDLWSYMKDTSAVRWHSYLNELHPITLKTPLIYAVEKNNLQMASLLLFHGADPNKYKLFSPLHKSIHNPHIVKLLLEYGADPNSLDPWGETPIFSSIVRNCQVTVQLLLEYGVSLDIQNKYGYTPWDLIYRDSTHPKIRYLIEPEYYESAGDTWSDYLSIDTEDEFEIID